jgi:4-hydroxybenzoate polyprenyltransferase
MPDVPRWLSFARLMRLPNVFTAFADIALAGCAAGVVANRPLAFVLLLLASGCLYLGGMVWNDVFDIEEDRKARPFRPLPSGQIRMRTAVWLAIALSLTGVGFAALADGPTSPTLLLAGCLAVLIVLYDGVLKHYPVGPLGMGGCRFLNVLMGSYAFFPEGTPDLLPWHLAGTIGIYITGVTWFARTEEGTSDRRQLIASACLMLLAVGLAVTVPVHLKAGTTPWYFPYCVAAFGFFVSGPVVAAIRQPVPKRVQAGVKRCIFGLVVLDAAMATAFVGWPGLLIVLLLLPATWLGKRVYST